MICFLQLTFYAANSLNEISKTTRGIRELFNMGKNITTGLWHALCLIHRIPWMTNNKQIQGSHSPTAENIKWNPYKQQYLSWLSFLMAQVWCTLMNKTPVPSWGHVYLWVTEKCQTQVHYENTERHFTTAALAVQTEMQEISKHYVVMLLLTDTSLQSLDLEMNHLNFVIICGKVSSVTMVIIEGTKK